jgi:hypothetical protein
LVNDGGNKRNFEGGLGEIRVSEGRVNLISQLSFNNTNLINILLLIKFWVVTTINLPHDSKGF